MKQAVILAAGEGRRLKPFTITRPKAMLQIAGKPIIHYVLHALIVNNIRDIIIIVGYQKQQIYDYIGDGSQYGMKVNYITQDKQLGTAHALSQAQNATDDEFLVLPGDKLLSPQTLTQLIQLEPPAILVKQEDIPSYYGVVSITYGKVTGITEKPAHPTQNIINTGIYTFNKSIFDFISRRLDIPDALKDMIAQGKSITAVENNNAWLDTVYPWDILMLNSIILSSLKTEQKGIIEPGTTIKGEVHIGRNTIIHPNSYIAGPVLIGEGCIIGPNTCILPSTTISRNVIVSPHSEVRNVIIEDDVYIDSGSIIRDSIVDKGCIIGTHFNACSDETTVHVDNEYHNVKIGSMLGRSCQIGNSVTSEPGTILGNYCQVKSTNLIRGYIPDRSLIF